MLRLLILVIGLLTTGVVLSSNLPYKLPNEACNVSAKTDSLCKEIAKNYENEAYNEAIENLFLLSYQKPLNNSIQEPILKEIATLSIFNTDTFNLYYAYNDLINHYITLRNFDSAYHYFEKQSHLLENPSVSNETVWYYNNLADLHRITNNFMAAESLFKIAYSFTDSNVLESFENEVKLLISINVADLYLSLNYFEQALKWIDTIQLYNDTTAKNYLFCSSCNTIASYKAKTTNSPDSVLSYLNKVIKPCIKIGDDYGKAQLYAQYLNIYLDKENYKLAKLYLDSINFLRNTLDAINPEPIYDNSAIKYYFKTKNYLKTIEVGQSVYEDNFRNISVSDFENVRMIAESYYNIGNFNKAYVIKGDLLNFSEKLKEKELEYTKNQIKASLELNHEKLKNQTLEVNYENRKKIIQLTVALIVLLVMLLLLIVLLFSSRSKQQKKYEVKLTQAVNDKVKELTQSNLELKQANKELENFAYITAHDLKTYAKNINMLVDFLDGNEQKTVLEKIKSNTSGLNSLLQDMTEYSISKNNNKVLNECNLNDVVNNVLDALEENIKDKQAVINIKNKLPVLKGNKTQLFLVFKNLIENGIKYNNSKPPVIEISTVHQAKQVIIEVKDNGLGISRKSIKDIFKMFNRGDYSRTHKGSGIGLAITKSNINKMGGGITVKSTLGKGSVFTLVFPTNIIIQNN